MLKPTAVKEVAQADQESTVQGMKPRGSSANSGRVESAKRDFNPLTHTASGKELPPELVIERMKLADQLSNSLAKKDLGFVQRLAELLQLSPEQQQQVLALYHTKRNALNLYQPGEGVTSANMLEKAESAEVKFNQALKVILEPSQVEKYNAFRKQQIENKRMASAQKDFADVLDKVDLNPEQQKSLQAAIQQAAMTKEDQNLDKTRLFDEAYEAMGFGSAGIAMSQTQAANTAILQSTDRVEMAKVLVDERKRATAERIALLSNVLSPAQLSQYTAVLESRDQSFFSSITPHLPAVTPHLLEEEK
jgi:cell pole-organizing protein PopZ